MFVCGPTGVWCLLLRCCPLTISGTPQQHGYLNHSAPSAVNSCIIAEPVEDMTRLSELTEESILENLRKRYEKEIIYVIRLQPVCFNS